MTHNSFPPRARIFALTFLCLFALAPCAAAQTRPEPRRVESSVLIRWQGKPGINRYRLQVARDEKFEDIVFDQAVEGLQHAVKGLPSGNYYWRVAAAAAETGAYSRAERVAVTGVPGRVEVASVLTPADTGGWRTATGEVARLVPAQLRAGPVVDFVGVGEDGRVFAVDGASGISLWNARFNPDARAPEGQGGKAASFAPVPVQTRQGVSSVVVAFDRGVRALRGETGREAWRARLEGRAGGGAAGDINGDGSAEVVVVTAGPDRLYLLDGATGRVVAEQKLDAEAIGAPFLLTDGETRGIALALRSGHVEIRGADGGLIKSERVEAGVTTAPLVFSRGQLEVLVVGTGDGLAALKVPDLQLLGNIRSDGDAVRGVLNAADVDGDGAKEIVMLTQSGRVALVGTVDGAVKWHAEGATDAGSATFADMDGDGVLDVIVPGGSSFALGFSGSDGSLVMRVEEGGARPGEQKAAGGLRQLVVAPSLSGGGVLVGGDPSKTGLRAVELPKGSVRAAK